MSVVAPPRPDTADERSLEERVAELEALIEEARQHARRRRRRNAALVVVAVLAAGAATFAGGDGVRVGTARSADAQSPRAVAGTSDAGRWSVPSGPPGFVASAIVVDPRTPRNVYVATGGRVFRSTNGGQSWRAGRQWGIANRVDALAIDPQRPATLYAGTGTGVLKSVDAGRSWRPAGTGIRDGLTPEQRALPDRGEGLGISLVVSPVDRGVVYAVVGGGVTKTTNGGTTWHPLLASPRLTVALTMNPSNPRTLYATTELDWTGGSAHSSIVMTSDGGQTWRSVLPRRDGGLAAIAVDPGRPASVYAVGTAGVLVTADGGRSWGSAGPAPASDLNSLAIDPTRPGTMYVSSWSKGVFGTSDGGRNWHAFGAGAAPGSWHLAIAPSAPSTLYVGIGTGVAKTVDGGRTWQAADRGIVASNVESIASDPNDADTVYAGTDRGLYRSNDRGMTWRALGLLGPISGIAVDPQQSARILASTSLRGRRGIMRSTDGGQRWTRAPGSTGNVVTAIAFDAHHAGTVVAGTWGAGVITSTDGGETWSRTARPPGLVRTIAIDPLGSGTIYAGGPAGLSRSADGGSSWRRLRMPGAARPRVLAFALSEPQTLYASVVVPGRTQQCHGALGACRLMTSADGGAHWRVLRSGMHDIDATALAVDPLRASTVYAVTGEGILRTADGGATWRPFNAGLPVRSVSSLAFDRAGTMLYAGTSGGGLVSARIR
jgi:photosystem II stability/assembly factor-like uncharacterized protein